MSRKAGRNDPCPCGSGKKYKKCCLAADERSSSSEDQGSAPGSGGVARALGWLAETYPDEGLEAIETDYYGSLSEDERQAIEELSEELYEMQRLNALEWLVADGSFVPEGASRRTKPVRFIDVLLSDEGPLLDVVDRDYLRRISASPLKLYEIIDVEPGHGIWLQDAFRAGGDEAEVFFVLERSGSQSARKGHALGARVLAGDPAILSGAVYSFSPEWFLGLRREILTGPGGGRRRKVDPGLVSRHVIDRWLGQLVQGPPELVDAATGEPLLLTTVHYRVRDWARVEAALEADPLVDPEDDGVWTFFESEGEGEEAPRRVDWTVTRRRENEKDRIEVFARTGARADEAERWFAAHTEGALEKIAREITDPAHFMKDGAELDKEPELLASPLDAMSPDDAAEFAQKLHEHIHRNWHNEPIPVLGNKTPKQAMRSESGRSDVVQLLKSYETNDQRRAEAEASPRIDYGFLWDRLGLSRE